MRGKTAEDQRLLALMDPAAEAAGYAIVRLRLMGGDHARRLQVMAERADRTMPIEDCARLARRLSALLDEADPVRGDYVLEVSSPGLDRPLTTLEDFTAYEGFQAKIELDRLADGRKRFKGVLAGVEGESIAVNLDGEDDTVLLPFAWVSDARLVIDEALLKRGSEARAQRLAQDNPPTHELPSQDHSS